MSAPTVRRIVTAYTINRIGSWVGTVALSLAVYDHTHSALTVSALLFAWLALPAFVVPVVVVWVEASSRRRELSYLYFFEAAATAALAVLLSHFWLPAFLLLAALDGTASLTANALLRTEAARAGREELAGPALAGESDEARAERLDLGQKQANGAVGMGFSVAFIVGPILGGVITAAVGAGAALFVDVATFAICGALLLDLHPHLDEAKESSVVSQLRAAWGHVTGAPALRALLATEAVAMLFIQGAGPIEVVYAKRSLGAGDSGYGIIVTAWGLGALAGSFLFNRAPHTRLGVVLSLGTFALALAFFGYAIAPTLLLACLAAAVGGAGNTLEWPALTSLVQRMTPPQLHGRVMGGLESLASLASAGGLLLGGLLVAVGTPRSAFVALGVPVAVAAIAFLRLAIRSDRLSPAYLSSARRDDTRRAPGPDSHSAGVTREPSP